MTKKSKPGGGKPGEGKPGGGKLGGKPGATKDDAAEVADRPMQFRPIPIDSSAPGPSSKALEYDQKLHQTAREKQAFYTYRDTKHGIQYTYDKNISTIQDPAAKIRKDISKKSTVTVDSLGSAHQRGSHSSFTTRNNKARGMESDLAPVEQIGKGDNGYVYALVGTDFAVKLAISGQETLFNDWKNGLNMAYATYNITVPALQRVADQFAGVSVPRIPTYSSFQLAFEVVEDSEGKKKKVITEWWETNKHRFEDINVKDSNVEDSNVEDSNVEDSNVEDSNVEDSNVEDSNVEESNIEDSNVKDKEVDITAGYYMERILSLPHTTRTSFINRFWPQERRRDAKRDPENQTCLIQPVLSERFGTMSEKRKEEVNSKRTVSLKNFPLYLDELNFFIMGPNEYAKDMAVGLATAHFGANMHTSDAEFVIGCRRINDLSTAFTVKRDEKTKTFPLPETNDIGTYNDDEDDGDFRNRAIQLWMIDFGGCGPAELPITAKPNDEGYRTFVGKCRATNPMFYPSYLVDNEEDFTVFADFCLTYMKAANRIQEQTLGDGGWAEAIDDKVKKTIMLQPALIMFAWITAEDELLFQEDPERSESLREVAIDGNWRNKHIRPFIDELEKAKAMWKIEKAEKAGKRMTKDKKTQTE